MTSSSLTKNDSQPRLGVELVPSTCWWSNVRSNVTSTEWSKCKRFVRERSGSKCEICGGRGPKWPVECHEIWDYNDETLTQTLAGLIALCPNCHEVKHIGRAILVGNGVRAIEHLCAINGWDEPTAKRYLQNVQKVWEVRSGHSWSLNVDYLLKLGIEPRTDRP